jgi:hypothetical protein
MTLIQDLIHIPDRVQKGDFVLRLTEGVTRADDTLRDYVITPELETCFNSALIFIRSALQAKSSRASYLHGSFGSGKSHFMAVLHLILQGNLEARKIKKLASVITQHNDWIEGKRFLLVPYHMIGAHDMESGILGGYADFMRRTHPDAPIPGVYLAEGLFQDAQALRDRMGDDAFFAALNESSELRSGWGDLEAGWTAERFETALLTPPMPKDTEQLTDDDKAKLQERQSLVGALIKTFFQSYQTVASGEEERFVSLDQGLSIVSQHAKSLGYDAVILFLDELILWLASRATDLKFVHQEGQKLAKLVEAQTPDRPVPIISFVARQRDLSELIGDAVPGAERLNFGDALKHWEGRFDRINLEDRNLPAIAQERILKCKTPAARAELDTTFEQTKIRESVMTTLLTREGDREMFRKVYPFSPALVQTLIAVSSVLQRERTALKVMMQLLVDQRDTLTLGDIVPVGDLFDVIAHGDEAFSPEMALHFNNAKRLYHQKLLPLLEKQHGIRYEDLAKLPAQETRSIAFRNHDRLIKTLLLSALVPEVESLRALNAERLAALNHGTIKTPIAGREGSIVLNLCRTWAANVGELRISEDQNPSISIQLSGVDTERIFKQAEGEVDNRGNRIRLLRQMVFDQLKIEGEDEFDQYRTFEWRGTKRSCVVLFKNIRELPDASLENESERWKLIIDFPFEDGHSPRDDLSRLDLFKASFPDGAKTLCWVPAFFSADAQKDLGALVTLEHVLAGDRFSQYANHLSPQDRQAAKSLLENQCSQLRQQVKSHIDAAYGLEALLPNSLDTAHPLELSERFVSLYPGLELQPPVATRLEGAMLNLFDQALTFDFPAAPLFAIEEGKTIKLGDLEKVYQVLNAAALTPDNRVLVEKNTRLLLRQIANPLRLAEMGHDATHLVLDQHWRTHFNRKSEGGSITVSQLRDWIDQPKAMGLPKDIQNLIILTFAAQTNRTFYLHNTPIEPTLKEIDNRCELREQKLPDESQWQLAVQRAASIFGIQISPLRKANNVADIDAKVTERSVSCQAAVDRYVQSLRTCLDRFNLDPECDRLKTAATTFALIEQINSSDDVVKTLAGAAISTSEAAMKECLSKAATLASALDQADWEVFEFISSLTDDRASSANELRRTVEQALCSDEYIIPLSSTLKTAQTKARALLIQPMPAAESQATLKQSNLSTSIPVEQEPESKVLPASIPTQKQGQRIVNQGIQENLGIKPAQDLMSELVQTLAAGQTIRFSISWIVEEGNSEP